MNSYKILVIEDEKNICNFMKMIFETNDYQVIFAQNGKNGLTMFFSHNPDLVILDLGLPDMDGVDVIKGYTFDDTPTQTELSELLESVLNPHESIDFCYEIPNLRPAPGTDAYDYLHNRGFSDGIIQYYDIRVGSVVLNL